MSFAVGSLVRARGREWVVLPESSGELVVVRPLGGTDDEVTGIYMPLETVEPATFALPDPAAPGDYRSARLLRDAVRLSSRACAGPFRSFARIAVEPRPYQLVPLLLALRQQAVRLLIADDVGIGKTVEAALIARELFDRGEITRMAVLAPPHLAEQWQRELRDKFHLEAEVVLSSTATRLERECRLDESLFDRHPVTVVSTDFIKSEARRQEFVNHCPELVIVDEAHTCASALAGRGGRHQRHELVLKLAADPERHLILVTATPHSGKDEAFRSLLGLLDPALADLPEDLSGKANEAQRRRLAAHLVQRRRGDIRHFMQADTPFPTREERESTYRLSHPYRQLFERVLDYTRQSLGESGLDRRRQRVRWWSALSLLRALASSPAAAAATLRVRAATADAETADEVDEIGRRLVLDEESEEVAEGLDVCAGADPEPAADTALGRKLREFARDAEALEGADDAKLEELARQLKALLKEGFRPIVFCRFVPTAEYVAARLREKLAKAVEVQAVTGMLPPAEREERVLALSEHPQRVLVCTDCLSEGINLQEHFDAVVHYDLAWSPTRHEQREGRVDRFGQPRDSVRALTLYGRDNGIDGLVLEILLQKHKRIRDRLGISVPVPGDTNALMEAIAESFLLRGRPAENLVLPGMEEFLTPRRRALDEAWEAAAEREQRSRTVFAQESIKPDEVARELAETRAATGGAADVERFVEAAVAAHAGVVRKRKGVTEIDLRGTPRALRDALGHGLGGREGDEVRARFELPVGDGVIYLARTHPFVEGLASHVLDTALDATEEGVARRCGAIRTRAVSKRTTLLLVRFRFDLTRPKPGGLVETQLAEEVRVLGFAGAPASAEWIDDEAAEALLDAAPDANVSAEQARTFVTRVVEGFAALAPRLDEEAASRAAALADSHRRVRAASRQGRGGVTVTPQLPPDLLGIYVFLPAGEGGS